MNKIFFCLLVASIPFATFAATYKYYKPVDTAENKVLLSWGPFGTLENYDCNTIDYSCLKTDKKSYQENPSLTISTDQEWYNPEKSFLVYRAVERTASEKITRYFFSSFVQNQWSLGKQLSITDDVQKFYWPRSNQNEFVYITNPDTHGSRSFVRFNVADNREISRKLVSGAVTNGTVSPDGQWIAYYMPLKENKKSTVLLHLLPVTEEYRFDYSTPQSWELLTDANRLIAFSASSTRFAFLEDSNNFAVARIVDIDGTSPISLGSAEVVGGNTIGTAADIWFPTNDTLLLEGNDKEKTLDWHLYSYNIPTKQLIPVVDDISYMYEMMQKGDKVMLGKMSGPNLVPILYDPAIKQYHEFNLEKSAEDPALSKEVVTLKNNLSGVLMKKKGMKITSKTPLVVWLHGGPYRQIAKDYHSYPSYAVYDWVLDQLVSQGAVVLKMDYQGSYGYGNSVAYNLVSNAGKQDVDGVHYSVKEIKKKLNLKGGVYLMGNSYGGYLSPRVLVAYPKEFNGAIAINGVFEWRTLLEYLRTSLFNAHFGGLYNPDETKIYDMASISNRIKGISPKQKIVVIHGMADTTINPDQSFTFYELLKNAGKNVKIVSIPKEDHIFAKASSIETICRVSSETIGFKVRGTVCQFK